jgi:hypothetical protein
MLIELVSNIVAFLAAIFLARVIAGWAQNLAIFAGMKMQVQEYFTNNADLASKNVGEAINGLVIPQVIKDFILKDFPDTAQTMNSAAASLSERVFYLMLLIIVYLTIFIIVRVAFYFLEAVIEKVFKKVKLLDTTDKILGAVFGVADAVVVTFVILALFTLLSSRIPAVITVISESAIVSKLFFNNWLLMILT